MALSGKRNGIKPFLKNLTIRTVRLPPVRSILVEAAARWPTNTLVRAVRAASEFQIDPEGATLIAAAIRAKPGCNFLVFGLGNDSPFWATLNRGGRTVFLEDSPKWCNNLTARYPRLEAHLVNYGTRRSQWTELLDRPHELEMALPETVANTEWDVVLVDGPKGFKDSQPGRMKSIYCAAQLVRRPGQVFVDDVNREVESVYADRFLGAANMVAEAAVLKQFAVK